MNHSVTYHYELIKFFIRYLLVGLTNTVISAGLMFCGSLLGMNYLEYTAIAYFITIMISFFMNMKFTFKVKGNMLKRLLSFVLFCVLNVSLVELIEYTLIEYWLFKPWVAIICGMIIYSTTGFFVSRKWIYK